MRVNSARDYWENRPHLARPLPAAFRFASRFICASISLRGTFTNAFAMA